ncbi:hypothetical protein ACA877_004715 [Vibrio alginolyticus]|uniref:hypothetical protein n=1 Tax=Vibrio TaxID=662 RepID=UPI0028094BD1|nr:MULTISPECIES: hypothetical protein [unclassified Vibrio]EGR0804886.1 hypothetical protein [Vibrio alginolyticus]EJL6722456.1 hypothetical protein [Vibrio alginolyticus]ELA8079133.1 hypothetical protein [Vibrio alginolyticus]MDW1522653.1 hypothetical protein [Vibrio sp. Vb5032]MDW1637239.1 hypothetical protein [Vibrio sp. Vb2907]
MEGIFGGVVSGVVTSFLVGLFLLWKGDALLASLRNMPNSWKFKFLTSLYLYSLKRPTYSYAHATYIGFVSVFYLTPVFMAGSLFFTNFKQSPKIPDKDVSEASDGVISVFASSSEQFILIGIAFVCIYFFVIKVHKGILDAVAPLCTKEFDYLRSAVAKCGTDEQYIEFLNLQSNCESRDDILKWLNFGTSCLGGRKLTRIDEIIQSISVDTSSEDVRFPEFLK